MFQARHQCELEDLRKEQDIEVRVCKMFLIKITPLIIVKV